MADTLREFSSFSLFPSLIGVRDQNAVPTEYDFLLVRRFVLLVPSRRGLKFSHFSKLSLTPLAAYFSILPVPRTNSEVV